MKHNEKLTTIAMFGMMKMFLQNLLIIKKEVINKYDRRTHFNYGCEKTIYD